MKCYVMVCQYIWWLYRQSYGCSKSTIGIYSVQYNIIHSHSSQWEWRCQFVAAAGSFYFILFFAFYIYNHHYRHHIVDIWHFIMCTSLNLILLHICLPICQFFFFICFQLPYSYIKFIFFNLFTLHHVARKH